MKALLFIIFISIMAITKQQTYFQYKLLVFEGSDWCANCHRLEKNILSDSLFINQLGKNSIEVERIDFPQRKKLSKNIQSYNRAIAEKYEFDGVFPTLLLIKKNDDSFQKIAYQNQSVEEFLKLIQSKLENSK